MKIFIALAILIAYPLCAVNAQVGIGTTTPDNSSALHIESNNSGLLIPKLTSEQRDNIIDPANGLLIFNTDSDEFQFNAGNTITPNWLAFSLTPTATSSPGQSVKYSNSDITTNINQNTPINLPVCGNELWNDNTSLYSVNAVTNEITINETGRYRIVVNAAFSVASNGPQRANPEMYVALDDMQIGGFASTGYMRRNSGHNESSVNFTEVIEVTGNQVLTIKVQRAGNNGTVNLRSAGTTNVYIEKIL
ncbi:hypothetical protein [Winogradskyella sp. A3E31]|uniref:hypothetical protein n=1 Tax=Winogradskyella sp. A3E31 TaxID=3349637 RepID=UPI00398BA754